MFSEALRQTPFTGGVADEVFPHILGDTYRHGDNTFVATMRAVLHPRMKDGERAIMRITMSGYSTDQIEHASKRRLVDALYNDRGYARDTLVIHILRGSEESNKKALEKVSSAFTEVYTSFSAVDRFSMFFKKNFNSLCFIDIERRKTVLFVEDIGLREWHLLQRGITILFPWFFEGEKMFGKDDLEYKLLNALNQKTPTKYVELLKQLAEPYDFRKLKIKQLLSGFEHRMEQQEIDNIRRQIDDCLVAIQRHNEVIRNKLSMKNECEIRLLGLQEKINQSGDGSEMMDFFLSNESVFLDEILQDGTMCFTVSSVLESFNDEIAERVINNYESFIYWGAETSNITKEEMKMLMSALFINQTLTMNMCAGFELTMNGRVEALQHRNYGDDYKYSMPNPHLHYYGCLGNYRSIINDMLVNNDYVGAITQCIASCKSLNLADTPVMERFMHNMYENDVRCINLPDGSVATPTEAITWLKSQQTAKHTD